jgi:hypothetical protein
LLNLIGHTLRIGQAISICEVEHPDTMDVKVFAPRLVVRLAILGEVLSSICFDSQPMLRAIEVENVRPELMLPPKLGPLQLAASENAPQLPLRIG